jgi:RNA polymerase sigma factor (sigma-70 family)
VHSLAAPSDRELLEAVRAGDTAAYGSLFERHKDAALRVARRNTPDRHVAEDAVNEAFASVLATIQHGSGPVGVFAPYLISSVTRAVYRMNRRSMRETPVMETDLLDDIVPDPTLTVADFDNEAVRNAFKDLPARWREVLWYLEIEELQPREAAPMLGLSPNATVALHRRAKEGLRLGYLQQHLAKKGPTECRTMAGYIPAYVLGTLRRKHIAALEEHLETCAECKSVLYQLRDMGRLRAAILPILAAVPLIQVYPTEVQQAGSTTGNDDSPTKSVLSSLVGVVLAAGVALTIAGIAELTALVPLPSSSPDTAATAGSPLQTSDLPTAEFDVISHSGPVVTGRIDATVPDTGLRNVRLSLSSAADIVRISHEPKDGWSCSLEGSNIASCTSAQPLPGVFSAHLEMIRPSCPATEQTILAFTVDGNEHLHKSWASPCSSE